MKAKKQQIKHDFAAPGAHAMGVLGRVASKPFPVYEAKTATVKKLLQFKYIRLEERQSPYKTHAEGSFLNYMVATEKGLKALNQHIHAQKITPEMKEGS